LVLLLLVGGFIVTNATFNNISVISWWSVLLVEAWLLGIYCHLQSLCIGGDMSIVCF